MSAASSNQQLPPKEAGIFKKIVRCYESKQYKNGLKFSRQILSNPKYSDHGETLAMKGLLLSYMGRKEEAFEYVRRGLKNDLRSHVCWHVYGLLQRMEKKYDEAIKCYRNALKWDKENVQILRDLSLLQIQMRDVEGFRDTRYQLLKVRPAQRTSWVGYALAYHLLKDYPMALKVVAEYRKTMVAKAKPPDYEYSEMILYEVQLMLEAGLKDEALKHMKTFESNICDPLSVMETRASVFMEYGQMNDAEVIYKDLVHRNPSNCFYLEQLEKCLGLDDPDSRLKLNTQLQEEYPRSHVIRRMPLTFTTGGTFHTLIDAFLRRSLSKGVPSLFVNVRPFYNNPDKVKTVEELALSYLKSLESCGRFSDNGPEESPCTVLWTKVFLAQHFDIIGNFGQAIQLVDQAIDHTPTEVQLYMTKARILKHAGDLAEAARFMEEARTLDTADRFVNCKCVKYLFRINQIDQAVETAGLFTREGLPTLQTMDEMQCMWFQKEMAMSYWRTGQLGEALQKLHEMDKHFSDMIDDQFDFHTYCMRRITLRSYISVLRLEDTIRKHPSYFEAAKLAIKIYIFIHDNPDAKNAKMNGDSNNISDLTPSELKKLQRKQKKAQLKAQEEKKENKPQKQHEEEKKGEQKYPFFDPKELLETKTPLEQALKFLSPLRLFSSGRIEPHLLGYAIHSRRRKFLLMLQSIKRAQCIDAENGELHLNIVNFVAEVEKSRDRLPDPIRTVIDESLSLLTHGNSLTELNRDFVQKHKESHEHLIYGAQAMFAIDPANKDKALAYITELSDNIHGRSLKSCSQVLDLLKQGVLGKCSNEVIMLYTQQCSKLFPMATVFRPDPSPSTQCTDKSKVSKPDKFGRKTQPVSNVAMSVLSGDINDGSGASVSINSVNIIALGDERTDGPD
ncbi:N-alpha-acetyltransferase 15, NatA auxiliary subunit-like [Halichondria panicea]|uniref:N-alpha-acetyltransferase 15, NatA auxiliary subunit-like n=1 Tax=Halichondria panicea TaxID=6063 RepID=UPI00312BB127